MALTVLRALEQSGIEKKNANVTVTMHNDVAIYLLNNHRSTITEIENRYGLNVQFKIDAVDNERGFELTSEKRKSQPKQKENTDADTTSEQPQNEKPAPKKNNNRRKKQKVENKETDVVKEEVEQPQPEQETVNNKAQDKKEEITQAEEKPAPKKRGRPAKKKIKIEEATEEKPKAADKTEAKTEGKQPSPTNDNAGEKPTQQADEDINKAAREAETVNETPKKKKKGWWNKITN